MSYDCLLLRETQVWVTSGTKHPVNNTIQEAKNDDLKYETSD